MELNGRDDSEEDTALTHMAHYSSTRAMGHLKYPIIDTSLCAVHLYGQSGSPKINLNDYEAVYFFSYLLIYRFCESSLVAFDNQMGQITVRPHDS